MLLKQIEKFKYLGAVFMSDGGQEIEFDARIVGVGTVMHQLQHLVFTREVGQKA